MKKAKELSSSELSSFSRQLALVVDSELSIQEGLSLIGEQTKSKVLKQLLIRTEARLNEGQSLSESFAQDIGVLPKFYIEMVAMGEQSGNLPKVLTRVADSYDKDAEISGKVVSAVTYPIILTVLMLGVIVLLFAEVLPMFDEVLSSLGGEMPGITLVFMSIGSFIRTYFYIIIAVIALIVLIVVLLRQTERGKEMLDALRLKTPIRRNIIKNTASIRFARSLAMLLRSGIGLAESVRMAGTTMMNSKIKALVLSAADKIEAGQKLKDALVSLELFPGLLLRILAVAESTGHTDDMLEKAADVMEEQLNERLTRLTTVLEPALIIVLSLIIGIVLISVILPVAKIMNAVG
ncbi:MAG: type II secretion system F family protein [Eubacteriales bacterium]|nr:type II secretion system F family protein [Eubacteriales bacterium]